MELNELPDEIASIRHIQTYTAPATYFDGLAEDILGNVNLPLAAALPLTAPPVNYFDGLADAILLKIKTASDQSEVQNELEALEPLLTTVSKKNVYRVPDGYFTSFSVPIPVVKNGAGAIKLRSTKKWMSYAAAAMIAGIMGIGIISLVGKNRQANDNAYTQALAKVSDNDLSDYLDQTSPADIDVISTSQDDDNTTSGETIFKVLLNNVSDNELENYLNENNDSDEKKIKGI